MSRKSPNLVGSEFGTVRARQFSLFGALINALNAQNSL